MAATRVDGEFSLVYLVFNTIFNLTDAGRAGRVLRERRGASRPGRAVRDRGARPGLQRLPLGQTVLPWRADPSGISSYVYDVVTQRLSGQHYLIEDGRIRQVRRRCTSPGPRNST